MVWEVAVEAAAPQGALTGVGTHWGVKLPHLLFLWFLGQVHTRHHDVPDARGEQTWLPVPPHEVQLSS